MGISRSRIAVSVGRTASIGVALLSIAATLPAQTYTYFKGFAFGSDLYTETSPNAPANEYIKVVQDGVNFSYSSENGHGYTDLSGLDATSNNREKTSCELYDQFIGAKSGGAIVFRIDAPDGDYRFVMAGGDAQYRHIHTIKVRDGNAGTTRTLINGVTAETKHYWRVGFEDKGAPACGDVTFLPQTESCTLSVTSGYIDLIQTSSNDGGDVCVLEIWQLSSSPTPPEITVQPQPQTVSNGGSATFSITASGNPPPDYQWYVNGSPAAGAISSLFTTAALDLSDNGNQYFCLVSNTQDTISSDTVTVTVTETGAILREYWTGISGVDIADLTSHADYPDNPSGSSAPAMFEAPIDWADNYGTRMHGYVHPPQTGNYEFWIASDDGGELWLSTGMDTASKTRIAYVDGWTGSREWNKMASQHSSQIYLEAGRKYYIEALQKEHDGEDNLAVGWKLPDGALERPIPGVRLSPYTGYTPPQYTLAIQISGSGSVSPGAEIRVDSGAAQTITASPNTGSRFESWSVVSGTATIADPASATTQITLESGDATIQASFALNEYTLDVSGTNGMVEISPLQSAYTHGQTVTLNAVADAGYHFVEWTGDLAGLTNPASIIMDQNKSITAVFGRVTYQLTVESEAGGTTTPAGAITVNHGQSTSLTAAPFAGYHFTDWTVVNGTATIDDPAAASTAVTLTGGDAVVRAGFTVETYTLTVENDGNGTTVPSGSISVNHGAVTTLSAIPAAGYEFSQWTVISGSAAIADPASAATSVSLTAGNAVIRAEFAVAAYTLTVGTDGNGTTTPAGAVSVNHGAATAIAASPSAGYAFVQWTVQSGTADIADPNAVSTTVTLTAGNAAIQAQFEPLAYQLTVQDDGNGSTTPSGPVSVSHGEAAAIAATPAAGYSFTNWTVVAGTATIADPNAASTTVILLDGDATIQAHFATAAYTLTVGNDGNGSTTPAGAITVAHGAATAISATPGAGYDFAGWTVTAGSATIADPAASSTTVTLTSGDASIAATFALQTYTLSVTSDMNGATDPAGDLIVDHGASTAITATPNTGYVFASWNVVSGSAVIANPVQASTGVILESGDAAIQASFVEDAGYRPTSQQLTVSGTLYDESGNPVGYPDPDSVDLTIRLVNALTGGDTMYTESFLESNDQSIPVLNGAMVVRLGAGVSADDLTAALGASPDLFVEITIEGETPDVLLPRTPLTASPYTLSNGASGATVLHGTGNPNDSKMRSAIGSFYVDDDSQSTWLRVNTGWIQID